MKHLIILALLLFLGLAAGPLAGGLGAQEREDHQERRLTELERRVAELRQRLDSLQVAAADTAGLEELRRQIDAISRQLEALQLGQDVVEAGAGRYGMGPAASKVYGVTGGVSIGGYGEMLYQNLAATDQRGAASGSRDRLDFLRGVFYVGYKFNDRILFNSEIEFEHTSTDNAGEVALEFAYLDFRLTPWLGARGGLLLIPMGYLNEMHEPPIFLGTERPETERRIIPTTWREAGLGLFGEAAGLSYRAYLVNGFDGVGGGPSRADGFGATGLRGGRQNGSRALAENFAGVGRVDYIGVLGLNLGTSVYYGNSGQGNVDSGGRIIAGRTLIWEGHAQYRAHGLWLRGLATVADVNDVPRLNAARGLTGSESIGEHSVGWYLEGGYDVLHPFVTEHQLIPYLRHEELNTQDRVPAGFLADPVTDVSITTLGVMWKPLTEIALKTDYQIHRTGARTGVDQWNVSLGYLF